MVHAPAYADPAGTSGESCQCKLTPSSAGAPWHSAAPEGWRAGASAALHWPGGGRMANENGGRSMKNVAGQDELLCSANREPASHSASAAKCPRPARNRNCRAVNAGPSGSLRLHQRPAVAVAKHIITSELPDAYSRHLLYSPIAMPARRLQSQVRPILAWPFAQKVAFQVEGR